MISLPLLAFEIIEKNLDLRYFKGKNCFFLVILGEVHAQNLRSAPVWPYACQNIKN